MIEPVIVFVSTRDNPAAEPMINAAELYVIHLDGSHARRLTDNSVADAFPALAPGGRRLVFDSNRLRTDEEPVNTSDLFVMDWDGEHLHYLTRGSSASWSPDDRRIAYHASASGTGLPIRTDPGSATSDSDIFVIDVDDAVAGVATRTNLTNRPATVDDDPDWSPDGQQILFTSHAADDPSGVNPLSAEIWVMAADGSNLRQLTTTAKKNVHLRGRLTPRASPTRAAAVPRRDDFRRSSSA